MTTFCHHPSYLSEDTVSLEAMAPWLSKRKPKGYVNKEKHKCGYCHSDNVSIVREQRTKPIYDSPTKNTMKYYMVYAVCNICKDEQLISQRR